VQVNQVKRIVNSPEDGGHIQETINAAGVCITQDT